MAIIHNVKDAIVFYQEWNEDNGVAEPALIIRPYSETITIMQNDQEIIISKHEIKALTKTLNSLLK